MIKNARRLGPNKTINPGKFLSEKYRIIPQLVSLG